MIRFCADDYGLNDAVSARILECVRRGAINKVSVFPNFGECDLTELFARDVRVCLHLNLVEGACMGARSCLTDEHGFFRFTFGGLMLKSLLHKREFFAAVKEEIRAQVRYWKARLPQGAEFCMDSHQHTHMIPAVFRAMREVLEEEGVTLSYLRIPTEPISVYLKTPSLYGTYSPVNLVKQWLLNFLWMFSRSDVPTARFCGILFSGKMDARVAKILPKYVALGGEIEVLFHPGGADGEFPQGVVFTKFYTSQNRGLEYDSVINLSEGRVRE